MDLNTLATDLRTQAAANSTIAIDTSVFPQSVLDEMITAFVLEAGAFLTIAGVKPADIPDPVNGALTISSGTSSVLGVSDVAVSLTFTMPGDDLVAVIAVTMGETWTFSDSFRVLDIFPFNGLATASVSFIYATAAQGAYPWPGEPSVTMDLATGLNFCSNVTFGAFPLLSTLLGSLLTDASLRFYGAFSPVAGESLPVGEIRAALGAGAFTIGVAPNALQLNDPAVTVRVGTSDDVHPIQYVDLLIEADFNNVLQVIVGVPMSGDTVSLTTVPLANESSINSIIESLPGGSGFMSFIPSELTGIFNEVGLDSFSMVVTSAPEVTYLSLSVSTEQPWPVIPNVLTLDAMCLQIETQDPAGSSWTRVFMDATAEFLPAIFDGTFNFTVDLEKDTAWEVSVVSGTYYGVVTLGALVSGLSGTSVPDVLNDIEFANFGVTANRAASGAPFTYTLYGTVEAAFPLLETALSAQINLTVTDGADGTTILLDGAIVVGSEAFTIELDLGTQDSTLRASWTNNGAPLEFGDVASAFGWDDMPAITSDLDLALESASFVYDFTNGTLVFEAKSANYGNVVFATLLTGEKPDQTRGYFFLLDTGQSFSLSNLPLVGAELSKIESITVSDLNVIISSQPAIDQTLAGQVNALIASLGTGYPSLPTDGINGEFIASANMVFGSDTLPLSISLGGSGDSASSTQEAEPQQQQQQQQQQLESFDVSLAQTDSLAQATDAAGPSTSGGGITWFNIQKSFGPISIGRIGVMYQSSQQALWFEIDATLAVGPMSLSLVGMGIGSPITSFSPEFSLQGLGVSYVKPPIEIAGALVNLAPPGANYIEFEGGVTVSTSELTLEAFGYYGNKNGFSSMFIFGALGYPFGGPAAFFLTGVALGFGYNSNLRLPTIDEVQSFPFVQVLPTSTSPNTSLFGPNPTPIDVLDVIMNTSPPWVTATEGSLWFGAGITFTSFELVNSQAMLFVETGDELVISLIGDSRAQFPPAENGVQGPVYANIELDLEIRFAPDEGVFSAQAILASSSFVLDPACVLTGGFAFFVWYGESPYAGDFVLTLGGYNPGFTPPSYYPTVPIVGFHWAMDSSITISGGAYFALTPAVLMVGGRLEATYHSGNLKAWFDAHADVIVRWKPFWFDAQIGISIGASYKIDLLFTTATVSVELGVDLEFYGPPTGGSVHVDWYIISFTIPFGAGKGSGQAITGWSDVEAMLPNSNSSGSSKRNVLVATPTAGIMPSGTAPSGSTNSANSGKMMFAETVSDQPAAAPWLVRGSEFAFTASTPIPATLATVGGTYSFNGSTFDVFPLGWTGVSSTLTVSITDPGTKDCSGAFEVALLGKAVPASLWGAPPQDSSGNQQVPDGGSLLVPDQITGVTVEVMPPQIGASAGPVDVESALAFIDLELPDAVLPLSGQAQPTGDLPVNGGKTVSAIADPGTGIGSAPATEARTAILEGLTQLGYAPATANDSMTDFANSVGCSLAAEPLLVA